MHRHVHATPPPTKKRGRWNLGNALVKTRPVKVNIEIEKFKKAEIFFPFALAFFTKATGREKL